MLKRLNQRFATKSMMDPEKLNEYGYRPSEEEIHNPEMNWDDIQKMREDYHFEGDYHCQLCPKKILMTEKDLKDHLGSKFHNDNIKRYFKKNKKELEKRINESFNQKSKRIQKYSQRYQKLAWFSQYFRFKNELLK